MFDKVKDAVKDFSKDVKDKVAKKQVEEEDIAPEIKKLRLRLLKQNISPQTLDRIEKQIMDSLVGSEIKRGKLSEETKNHVISALKQSVSDDFDLQTQLGEPPSSVMLMGFNGSGKTTTAAKIAKMVKSESQEEPVLAAADTFRAASIEQLETHSENIGAKIIKHEYESDPAAVGYDAVEYADKHSTTAVIDTAGRSHGDKNLMEELKKTVRVCEPDVSLLVVDALSGNDIEEQIDAYEGLFDALVLTKMDVDDGGGVLVTASEKSGKPVAYTCNGQDYSDIKQFDKDRFFEEAF